jgi:hypothetical protein
MPLVSGPLGPGVRQRTGAAVTSELAVLNKLGVALAADSAVTIGGGPTPKIYDTVNKLFALSKRAPVGVMFYGNAEFMGVPWETLIKVYRSERLDARRFPHLQGYVQDLLDYVQSAAPFLSEELQANYVEAVLRVRFGSLRRRIVEAVGRALADRESISATHAQRLAGSCVNEEVRRWEGLPDLGAVSDLPGGHIRDRYGALIARVREEVFEQLPLSDTAHGNLGRLSQMYFLKDDFSEESSLGTATGVVIAGYGEDEIFPGMLSLELDGMLLSRLRYRVADSWQITPEIPAVMKAFAQQEMVSLFMEGVDTTMRRTVLSTLGDLLAAYPSVLRTELAAIPDAKLRRRVTGKLRDLGGLVVDAMQERFDDLSREAYWGPIVQAVSALPKDQLAAMAEALINLTSFKRRMSVGEAETVGGPIDVAVISKGDGFVWIRRKHYFRPELNPQFFQNYFRSEVRSTGEEDMNDNEEPKPGESQESPRQGHSVGRGVS